MKLFKGGLMAAVLAVVALTFGAASALAGPINGPYTGVGRIRLDGSLGGSSCAVSTIDGFSDDNTVDDITFSSCTGAAGTPWANNLPWSISWSGSSGTVAIDASANVLGGTCTYRGNVGVSYDSGTQVLTLSTGSTRVPRSSGHFLCPSSVAVEGTYDITPL